MRLSRIYSNVELTLSLSSTLVIDYSELLHATSDARLVTSLAKQTGYWPVFTFLGSMNHLIDLASVGLIGQKGVLLLSYLVALSSRQIIFSGVYNHTL